VTGQDEQLLLQAARMGLEKIRGKTNATID
jgi:hypothetical protein